jgi:hypothetical protein
MPREMRIVFTFTEPVTFVSASVTSGMGKVSGHSGSGTAVITVNLSGVTNAQTIQVTLTVSFGSGTSSFTVPAGVLAGDVNADRVVNSKDVNFVKSKNGQTTTIKNFRADVNIDGIINGKDASLVGSLNGTKLP